MDCPSCHSVDVVVLGVCTVCGHGAQPIAKAKSQPKAKSTAAQAWAEYKGEKAKIARLIIETIQKEGPLTDDQLSRKLGYRLSVIHGVGADMRKHGLLRDSGYKRRTRAGGMASAWKIGDDPPFQQAKLI